MTITQQEAQWIEETVEKLKTKWKPVTERNVGKIPYSSKDGVFDDYSPKDKVAWWTNGFWGGIMWQMYTLTGDDLYKKSAKELEDKLDQVLMDSPGLDHDNGFKWLPTSDADYRVTRDQASYNRVILADNNQAGRFNLAGRFIRAWNDWGEDDHRGWAIIDCMMNLPLLYWASEVTGDPRFSQIAQAHADTAMKNFVRGDGSVNHIVEFDPDTGEMIRSYGGQGYEVGSSWTRGQAWGLYGFALSYIHTGKKEYLDTSRKIAHYFISNTPESGLIPIDFRQPADCQREDSTAAAIAACGLIELAKHTEGRDSDLYKREALRLLQALDQKRSMWSPEVDPLLEKCTVAYHEPSGHEITIIYGDYYFIEAVMKLSGQELFIW